MTTPENPDAIRADIERSRRELSQNVDALTDTANPRNIAGRKVDQVKGAARSVREHLMGAPDDPSDPGRLGGGVDTLTDTAADLRDRAAGLAEAPQRVRGRTRGNPLAAGLIAFGLGYLVSSAIPSSQREQEAAQRLQEKAEPVKETLTESVEELRDRMREPARQAAESVKESAGEAVDTVKQERDRT